MRADVNETRIRPAEERDLPEVVRIYNHYVTTTHITFDTKAFSPDQRRTWFKGFSESGPYRLLIIEPDAGAGVLALRLGPPPRLPP